MKILVVEDVFIIRKLLDNFLHSMAKMDFAPNGTEAIDLFTYQLKANDPYDLICLDILLPKMDGIEVLKEIRNIENLRQIPKNKRVKIIIISTLADEKIVLRAINSGCDGYIAKPFTKERIFEELGKLDLYKPEAGGS